MKTVEGHFSTPKGRIAIVAARFNDFVINSMIAGAKDTLLRHGVAEEALELVRVPGAYELPLVCQRLARTERYAGLIALGAVIRGSTPHFDFVAGECASGLTRVSLDAQLPISFGVITTENLEHAVERAGIRVGNKGVEAALALIETLNVVEAIDG